MSIHYKDESVTLHHGDCLDVLRLLPDNSVDSVVCDPPYGLSNTDPAHVADTITRWVNGEREYLPPAKGGFMGKEWDSFVPPVAVWDECYRVLKPGGHLLAFAGSRTHDLMTLSIRLAGFDIRDSIAWLYGCHDDQTEVLTRRGWVNGLDLTADDDVAQWSTDGTVELVRPTARQRYDYDGDLIAFRNADVDQLVTPNHRVYRQVSERRQIAGKRAAAWSDWQADQAADINRWQPMRLPAAGTHDGPGIGGTDYAALLGWVWAEGGFDPSGTGVRVYQSSTNAPLVDEIAALFDRLGAHKRYDYVREWKGRPYTATTWFITGDLARRVRADLPGKSPTYELLWRMTSDEKRALWDAAMKGDGSKARRAFWQKSRDDLEWAQALLASIGCRGKIADDPRGVIHWTDRPTVELQARHLAAADPVPYRGEVWCVTVPSGAFIVRRDGRVSVSGNSGFPKSLDVSKAIDKAAGAEREVVGTKLGLPGYSLTDGNGNHRTYSRGLGNTGSGEAECSVTAPATDAAREWQGWGTALKPSHEPVVCARKPFSMVPLGEEVDRLHHLIGGLLWLSLSPAKRAELTSPSSPAGQHEATCVSALVSAALDTSPDASDETATFSSPALASTSSNIASSWSATLGALSARTRTSTTSTASSTTTALRTLNSLLGPITSQTTMPRCGCLVAGPSSPALSAASSSSDEWAKWLHTLSASVPATATEGIALAVASALASIAADLSGDQAAASSADPTATTGAAARDSAFEPIVVARKPLAGNVAANVLEHGTGALNIDGCRVATDDKLGGGSSSKGQIMSGGWHRPWMDDPEAVAANAARSRASVARSEELGRWPTNVVLDDTQAAVLDRKAGPVHWQATNNSRAGSGWGVGETPETRKQYDAPKRIEEPGDERGPSKFFPTFRYEAKAPASERPRYTRPKLRLRGDLTPEQVDHVRARLEEAGVQVD